MVTVEVKVPGFDSLAVNVIGKRGDTDRAVASRVATTFPPGTVIRLNRSEWVIGRSVPPTVNQRKR